MDFLGKYYHFSIVDVNETKHLAVLDCMVLCMKVALQARIVSSVKKTRTKHQTMKRRNFTNSWVLKEKMRINVV